MVFTFTRKVISLSSSEVSLMLTHPALYLLFVTEISLQIKEQQREESRFTESI